VLLMGDRINSIYLRVGVGEIIILVAPIWFGNFRVKHGLHFYPVMVDSEIVW
jgi:fumarate reductase subunit D